MKQRLLFLAVLFGSIPAINAQTNTFPASGNVGIGTTNPHSNLEIGSSSGGHLSISTNGINGSATAPLTPSIDFLGYANGKKASITVTEKTYNTYGSTLSMFLNDGTGKDNLAERLTIIQNGNVGIGTSNPQGKLDVNGEVLSRGYNAGFRVFSSAGDNINQAPWYGIGASNLVLSNNPAGTVQLAGYWGINFQTSAGQIVLLSNGNAGIGTTSPDQKLTVKGKIHAEEVIVDLNVPAADYVFAKDYSLMPLHKVEQYVKTNNHLPDVPSATEIKDKGLSMGEMQNKLLQKIEELTLYTIEQNKKMEIQQNEIQALKDEIQAMKK